jgi:hypothetical protein
MWPSKRKVDEERYQTMPVWLSISAHLLSLVKGTTHPSKYDVTGGLCF